MKPENPFAFPFQSRDADNSLNQYSDGMTLRDYFAAKAMQAIIMKAESGSLKRLNWTDGKGTQHPQQDYIGQKLAKWSYEYADAMLKER